MTWRSSFSSSISLGVGCPAPSPRDPDHPPIAQETAKSDDRHGTPRIVASAFDIAAGIKERVPNVGDYQLQKLLFYVQAWSLASRGAPAFDERIEASVGGPVTRDVWTDLEHHGGKRVKAAAPLSPDLAAVVDQVLHGFGGMSGEQLSHLTHQEEPWLRARGTRGPKDKCDVEITHESIRDYYAAKWADAIETNRHCSAPPAFTGSVDSFVTTFLS